MKLKPLLFVVLVFGLSLQLTACGEEEKPVVPVVEDKQRAVVEDWVTFQIPSVLREPSLDVEMQIKEMLYDIEVVWKHPSTLDEDRHMLTEFGYGNKEALYRIDAAFNNLLPGHNEYEVIGYLEPEKEEEVAGEVDEDVVDIASFDDTESVEIAEESEREALRMTFTLDFDLANLADVAPEGIDVSAVPDQTDSDSLEVVGQLAVDADAVYVFSWNDRSEKSSFTALRKFSSGDPSFTYNAEERFGNLLSGTNTYVVEARNAGGKVLSRTRFQIQSTKLTLMDQVEALFGTFSKNDQGWYVSSEKPWFSLRPVYEWVSVEKEERYSIIPRPTLTYTADSSRETSFCDYLGAVDYEEEGMSYRAYSYETCQSYRYGVAAYDRFLSLLAYEPMTKVLDVDYADIRDQVSSAFVMLETGGMPERDTVLTFNDDSFGEEPREEDADVAHEGPYYYVYQMLIADQVPYEEGKIGDIAEEADEARAEQIEEVKAFLVANSGDELFTELLFTGKNALDPPHGEQE